MNRRKFLIASAMAPLVPEVENRDKCKWCKHHFCKCEKREIEPYYSPFHCYNCKGCIGNCTGPEK